MGKLSNTLSGFDWLQNDAFIEISEDGDSVYLFPYNFDAVIRLERTYLTGHFHTIPRIILPTLLKKGILVELSQ